MQNIPKRAMDRIAALEQDKAELLVALKTTLAYFGNPESEFDADAIIEILATAIAKAVGNE